MIESIDYGTGSVTIKLKGTITSAEIMDVNTQIINSREFLSLKYQLWIFDAIEDFLLSAVELEKIAQQDLEAAQINPAVKVAIVTDSSLVFGFGRMYEAYTAQSTWETMVFYNLDEAKKWLEID